MTSIDIAKYIVTKAYDEGSPISNIQLQFYMYFIQMKFLQEYDAAAFMDRIEAWNFGPVVRAVYAKFSFYGAESIRPYPDYADLPEYLIEVIDTVFCKLRHKSAWDLIQMVRVDGSPYYEARKAGLNIITKFSMKFYKEQ